MQFLIQLVIRITDQRRKAFFTTRSFDAAQHIDGVGIGDIGDNQADEAGTTML
ncbi:hypothetical protein D3C78_1662720 [compost metagenome]